MSSQIVNSISLSGTTAIDFAVSLFHPTRAEIERNRIIIDSIDRGISIKRTNDGFTATVLDLDLAFLRNANYADRIIVSSSFRVIKPQSFNSSTNEDNMSVMSISSNTNYSSTIGKDFLCWAA